MKRLLLIFLILVATSCAHAPDYPVPATPQFSTGEGQDCGIKCQGIYADCKTTCQGNDQEQAACISDCNKELGECYALCKELLE